MLPQPLFDTLKHFENTPDCVLNYLQSTNIPAATQEFHFCLAFLKNYRHSADTFTAYRREIERLLHWSWLMCKKSIKEIDCNDIRDYLQFVNSPPNTWVAARTVNRFMINAFGKREINPEWRPFVTRTRKNKKNDDANYQLSPKSIEAIFATIHSFFNFLQQEHYLEMNLALLIKEKKQFLPYQGYTKMTRKLTLVQWQTVMSVAEKLAAENAFHERTLFLLSVFYLLGARISELACSTLHMPVMGHFICDKQDSWWFMIMSKNNKIHQKKVPDELLAALKRYRHSLNLPPLPQRDELIPLFPKLKGKNGLGVRQIRNLIQAVLDRAILQLQAQNKVDEARELATATAQWCRVPIL